jgi:hypothetical protein
VAASAVNFYPLRLVILCNRNKRLSGLQNRHKLFLLYFLLWSWRGSFLNWERERRKRFDRGGKGEGKSPLRTRRERGCLCFVYFPLPFMTTDEKDGRKKGEIYFFFVFVYFVVIPPLAVVSEADSSNEPNWINNFFPFDISTVFFSSRTWSRERTIRISFSSFAKIGTNGNTRTYTSVFGFDSSGDWFCVSFTDVMILMHN